MSRKKSRDPIFVLPPFRVEQVMLAASQQMPWSMVGIPPLWSLTRGEGVRGCVLDTGVSTVHPDLVDALEDAQDFTGSRSGPFDVNGHGCIAPTDKVFTSLCGLQTAEYLFNNAPGIAHFVDGRTIVKDTSRYEVFTISADANGKPVKSKIMAVHKLHHTGQVHHVQTVDGRLTLTPWHPVFVVTSRRGRELTIKKKRADELKVGERLLVSSAGPDVGATVELPYRRYWKCVHCGYEAAGGKRPACRRCEGRKWHEGPRLETKPLDHDLAFWLGLVASDGHLSKRQRRVDFVNKDEYAGSLFSQLSARIFGVTPKRYEYGHRAATWELNCCSAHSLAAAAGIPIGRKSRSIDLPNLVTKSPRSVILSFLAGMLEGDGNVKDRLRLTTGSQAFAADLVTLLHTIGINASSSSQVDRKSRKPVYTVRIGNDQELLSHLRVKSPPKDLKSKPRCSSRIRSIDVENHNGPMYDLSVEGSHNYVANGHIVSNTWCCGAIFAKDDSGGVVGPLNKGKLLSGKVLGDNGSGSSEQVAAGIRWAVKKGVDFISMSLGSQYEAKVITRACEEAREASIPIIAAGGNEGPGPNTTGFPASLPWVISVGAYGRDGKIAGFSSRGKIDICGPGVDVLGCWPPRSVAKLSGTSMATPFVAAVVGMMIAKHKKHGGQTPVDTPARILEHLKATAIDAGPEGFDPAYGWGLIDPEKLLALPGPTPGVGLRLTDADLSPEGRAKLRAAGHQSMEVVLT